MRLWKFLAALLLLGPILPLTAQAQSHDCACVHNATNKHLNFRFSFGDGDKRRAEVDGGSNYWICWSQGLLAQGRRSQALLEMDIDMTSNEQMQSYRLDLAPSQSTNCNAVPPSNHYQISFEGNNFNRLQLTRGFPGSGSQPMIPPPTGQAPPYYPPQQAPYYPPAAAAPAPYYPPPGAQPPAYYPPPGAPAPYYPPQGQAPYYPPGAAQPQPYPQPPAPAPYYPPPTR